MPNEEPSVPSPPFSPWGVRGGVFSFSLLCFSLLCSELHAFSGGNKKTHNLEGLMLELQQLHIVDRNEINAILRLSDYGRLGGYVFKIISSTRWSTVLAKGKYVIAALRKEKTGNG